jgi:hypothetical protein
MQQVIRTEPQTGIKYRFFASISRLTLLLRRFVMSNLAEEQMLFKKAVSLHCDDQDSGVVLKAIMAMFAD